MPTTPTLMLAMDHLEWVYFMQKLIGVLFAMAFGACIGSLTNVLVYRLPLGLDVVSPPSRCPSCETRLTWRENIPIFGWLFLRGRCRFCRSKISAEYPLVEAFMAVLWGAVFLVLYVEGGRFLGLNFGAIRPEWAESGIRLTWPIALVVLTLFSCLTAMTLTDAKTCQIPMQLTTVPVVVALLAHPTCALWVQTTQQFPPRGLLPRTSPGEVWAMATPGLYGWYWIGGAIGGVVGLVISNILLAKGLIRQSFADYQEWETAELAKPVPPEVEGKPGNHPTDMWIQYPHARREMGKEIVFVAPCLALGLAGAVIAARLAGPVLTQTGEASFQHAAPLWLVVLAAVFLGYIIGGGVVWAMRMFGTLAFGKEAIGLGDVHMMAAVGACLGWYDAVLAFFAAAFIGVIFAVLGKVFSGVFRRAMPFGPYLAMGTVVVWFAKPLVERLMTGLMHAPVNLP